VVLDDPCYFNMHTNLALHGAKVITIARDCNGLDLEAFEQLLIAHRPVLYLTNSTLHHPTGHSFTAAQASRLLASRGLVPVAQRAALKGIKDELTVYEIP